MAVVRCISVLLAVWAIVRQHAAHFKRPPRRERRQGPDSEAKRRTRTRYLAACKEYQVLPSADVLACLQLDSPDLKIRRHTWARPFCDLDLHPLLEVFADRRARAGCPRLRSLDFSQARLGPAGVAMAARLLDLPPCRRVQSLDLSDQIVGSEGVAGVLQAARRAGSLRALRLKGCRVGSAGGEVLVELLAKGPAGGLRLETLDLRNNFIGFRTCQSLEQRLQGTGVQVNLTGNRVLDEVLNAVTHGIGCLLAMAGSAVLAGAARGKPTQHQVTVGLYCVSLNVLYLASTLFHSFFTLGPTVLRVFGVLDHCGIYLLIAGTYCPFLGILFHGDLSAQRLLAVLWVAAILGMTTTAFYKGPGKAFAETALYLCMGWSCSFHLGGLARRLGSNGTWLLVAGGLFYTGGVPLFVKDGRTLGMPDHTLWHLFVLGGSICHYLCVLWYCLPAPPNVPPVDAADD